MELQPRLREVHPLGALGPLFQGRQASQAAMGAVAEPMSVPGRNRPIRSVTASVGFAREVTVGVRSPGGLLCAWSRRTPGPA